MEPEIQEVARRLFKRRVNAFADALATRDDDASSMAPSSKVAACSDLFHRHLARDLRDYVALLELFGALDPSSREGTHSVFDAHVDETATALLSSLGATGHAERNRIVNESASIKSRARTELDEELSRAQQAASNGASEPDELDDRLPLGRRGAFDRDLERYVSEARRHGDPFALVMIDIDHFKKVNDEHGHPVGDEVLLEVARLVVARAAHKGAAYRYGGEEFSLLLPSYSAEEAVGLAERLRKDIESETVSSRSLRVTASFGAASVPDHGETASELLESADRALYEAKRGGRNRVHAP